jgi:hypothetical protein
LSISISGSLAALETSASSSTGTGTTRTPEQTSRRILRYSANRLARESWRYRLAS